MNINIDSLRKKANDIVKRHKLPGMGLGVVSSKEIMFAEGFGMRKHTKKYTDYFVKIDINKNVESLNISNSAAIVFHHINYSKKKVE